MLKVYEFVGATILTVQGHMGCRLDMPNLEDNLELSNKGSL